MLRFSAATLTAWALLLGGAVRGDMIQGASEADFIDANVDVDLLIGGVLDANVGDIVPASGTAPPSYSTTNSLPSIDVDGGLSVPGLTAVHATTGLTTSAAQSSVDGLAGSKVTSATHTIDNLDLNVGEIAGADVISITADTISVTSSITGGPIGSLATAAEMTVENLQIFALGTQVGPTLNGQIAPNTGIDLSSVVANATLVLNNQAITGVGTGNVDVFANAISLQLNQVGAGGIASLDGSVVVGLSEAHATLAPAAIPEPSSWLLLMFAGIGGVAAARIRRRGERSESQMAP